jgi:predicted phosphodiesterase
MSARVSAIAHICDVHVPDHDPALWASFLAWCRDEKPGEVMIGGDFLELESCSQHGGVARPSMLVEDIEAGRQALRDLRTANPRARMTYLEGNHETRLRRRVVSDAPELDGALDLPSMLHLDRLHIDWHPYGEVVRRGKLGFTHGWWTPEHHAAKHLREVGTSIAYGHTHRPQVYTRGAANGDVRGAFGMPCMRKLDADWLDGKPSGWMQGFGVHYVRPDGRFSPYMVLAVGGAFVWGGKVYGLPQRKAAA